LNLFNILYRPCYWVGAGLVLLCASCLPLDKSVLVRDANIIVLLEPEAGLGDDWQHRRISRADTLYEAVESSLGHSIRATGNQSASIVYRLFEPVRSECNHLRWQWLVRKPQAGSDLHVKGSDDVAASVFVLFGDPGIFQDKVVPTLKYVWANDQHQKDEIIAGPYHKGYIKTRVLRVGGNDGQAMVVENVNLREDYLRVFGEVPTGRIHGIAIFTDSDDTRKPIVAHYGKIELLCGQ
jgi:hypothetical protein